MYFISFISLNSHSNLSGRYYYPCFINKNLGFGAVMEDNKPRKYTFTYSFHLSAMAVHKSYIHRTCVCVRARACAHV